LRRGEIALRFGASHAWHVSGKQNGSLCVQNWDMSPAYYPIG
jgi:hypothetical protein